MVDSPLLLMISLPRLSNVYSLNPETVLLPPVQPLLNLNPLGSRPLPPPPQRSGEMTGRLEELFHKQRKLKGLIALFPQG